MFQKKDIFFFLAILMEKYIYDFQNNKEEMVEL